VGVRGGARAGRAGRLAGLDRDALGGDRRPRPAAGPARARAAAARPQRRGRPAADDHLRAGELLGFPIASEIGDVSLLPSARKLVGYSGLTPRITQSGQRERCGPAVEGRTGHAPLRPRSRPASRPGDPPPPGTRCTRRSSGATASRTRPRRRSPQDADRRLARARAPRAVQAERVARYRPCPGKLLRSSGRMKAHKRSAKPWQLQPDHLRPAPREISAPPTGDRMRRGRPGKAA
jgi:Transposase IS116/IS110/IS902 family